MKRLLFVLFTVVGLVPLAVNSALLLRSAGQPPTAPGTVVLVGVVLVLAGAWLASSWLTRVYRDDLTRFRRVIRRVGQGDYGAWVPHRGSHREAQEFGQALNRLAGNVADREDHLVREADEVREVATQSMDFIEELLKARVPLAKHHPGLIESYSRELVARKRTTGTTEDSRGFVTEVMRAVLGKKRRAFMPRKSRRVEAASLWLAAPITARITDLSASGMNVECHESPQGRDPRPFTIVNSDETLTIPASVRWCRLIGTERTGDGESAAIFRAGIEFEERLPRQVRDGLLRTLDEQAQRG